MEPHMGIFKKSNQEEQLIDYSGLVEDAKATAIELMSKSNIDAEGLFYETDLFKIEQGIKNLNEFSSKCWLVSAITLYALVYDQQLYRQSGLEWSEYLRKSRSRLGMDPRDVTEQLSSARFFIQYHEALKRSGWNPIGSGRKLARAELALALSGDLNATLEHLANDSWAEFHSWYSSFKEIPIVPKISDSHIEKKNIEIGDSSVKIDGKVALTIGDEIAPEDKLRIGSYVSKIFEAIKDGYEPAIIPVYDNKEANRLLVLRDKDRQKR